MKTFIVISSLVEVNQAMVVYRSFLGTFYFTILHKLSVCMFIYLQPFWSRVEVLSTKTGTNIVLTVSSTSLYKRSMR